MLTWYKQQQRTWIVPGIIGFLGGLIITSFNIFNEAPDPIKLIDAHMVDDVVLSTRVRIAYDVLWNEKCPAWVEIFVFKDNEEGTDEIVHRNGPLRSAYDNGHQKWVREVVLPERLVDGDYRYRARITGKCRDKEWPIAVPDMKFTIKREP